MDPNLMLLINRVDQLEKMAAFAGGDPQPVIDAIVAEVKEHIAGATDSGAIAGVAHLIDSHESAIGKLLAGNYDRRIDGIARDVGANTEQVEKLSRAVVAMLGQAKALTEAREELTRAINAFSERVGKIEADLYPAPAPPEPVIEPGSDLPAETVQDGIAELAGDAVDSPNV